MAPLTFAQALTQLQLMTGQGGFFTFTSDQLTQALQTAWSDTFVGNIVWDSTTTYAVGTWQYPIPITVTTVRDLYFNRASDQYPELLSKDLYSIVNGQIQFVRHAQRFLGDSYTIYVKGFYSLKTTDSLLTDNLVNYVLANAAYILVRQLQYQKLFVFLRNDTTLRDVIMARNDLHNDMLLYKKALLREFESS